MAYPSKIRFISLLGILAVVAALLVPALPKSIHAQDPAPSKIESDDASVTRDGTWHSQTANAASGGSYLYNSGEATLILNFAGASLEVIYVAGPSLGTLAIEVDGTVLRTVITTDTETRYGQVAKIDYLTDEPHELKVYAQGGGVIAVDAFVARPSLDLEPHGEVTLAENVAGPRVPFCDSIATLHRVSLVNGGLGQGNADSALANLSGDGWDVVFVSTATNLVVGDTNGRQDVFVRDQVTCETQRVSVATDGTQGNGDSSAGLMSGDGRYVVFSSAASNFVANDTNGVADIFIHDRQTRETTRIPVGSNGIQPNQNSYVKDLSSDARFILIVTPASNLDPADTENDDDFYIHDRQLGTTSRVVLDHLTYLSGGQLSDDGRYLTFSVGQFCHLLPCVEVYWYDRQTNTTRHISRANNGDAPTGGRYGASGASISADGRYVVFHSDRENLGDGVTTNCDYVIMNIPMPSIPLPSPCAQIFLYDSLSNQNTRLTLVPARHQAQVPDISADGRYVTYEVHEIDTNAITHAHDGYVLDRNTSISTLIGQGDGQNYAYSMSDDGRFVSFQSISPNLVTGDTNNAVDIFVEPTGGVTAGQVDALALFQPTTNTVSLVQTLQSNPPPAGFQTFVANPPAANGQWVMGDWDGDGAKTPGVYGNNGVFYYTDSIGTSTTWSAVWIGLLGRPPVAGRFNVAVNHDCVGAVDSAEFPPYGTAFALYFTCDLTNGTAPTLAFQWLSVLLPNSGGFSGTHQFAAGDFNNDGVDSIAIRRGEFIAFGNVPPTTLLSEFNLAQYWGVPPVTGGDYGLFLAGDFDNGAGDSFGVFYQNGNFYYRNAVDWYPGPHSLQQVGQPIGTPVQATSWR